jgi:hypothetical protein
MRVESEHESSTSCAISERERQVMSKFHGEQYWTTVRHHALCDWRDINDEEFDTLRAIGHEREVRERSVRERQRRTRKLKPEDLDA